MILHPQVGLIASPTEVSSALQVSLRLEKSNSKYFESIPLASRFIHLAHFYLNGADVFLDEKVIDPLSSLLDFYLNLSKQLPEKV